MRAQPPQTTGSRLHPIRSETWLRRYPIPSHHPGTQQEPPGNMFGLDDGTRRQPIIGYNHLQFDHPAVRVKGNRARAILGNRVSAGLAGSEASLIDRRGCRVDRNPVADVDVHAREAPGSTTPLTRQAPSCRGECPLRSPPAAWPAPDPATRPVRQPDQMPTITSEALMTAVAAMPTFSCSSSAASLVIDAVTTTDGETSIVTCVVVAPGFTLLMVPASWLRAESFMCEILLQLPAAGRGRPVQHGQS